MENHSVEGIVLKAVPYKESDFIVTLFTKEKGRLALYMRCTAKKRGGFSYLRTLLCRGEFVYKKGKHDLHLFLDGSYLNLHLPLRKSYPHLECAVKMSNALLKTQLPEGRGKRLYLLFAAFLNHLHLLYDPNSGWASFLLKLLKHEGMLNLEKESASFSKEEKKNVEFLTEVRSFQLLCEHEIELSLLKKIEELYASLL